MLPATTLKQVLIVNKVLNLNCNPVLPKNSQIRNEPFYHRPDTELCFGKLLQFKFLRIALSTRGCDFLKSILF